MKMIQLIFSLFFLIFAPFVSASERSSGFIFSATARNPHFEVQSICEFSEEWFRTFFTLAKNKGHNLNPSFKDGDTLLHIAIQENCPNMVKVLLELGADVFKPNSQNESSLEYISHLFKYDKGYENVWKVFKDAGYELTLKADENDEVIEGASKRHTGDDDHRPKKLPKTTSSEDIELSNAPISNFPFFNLSAETSSDLDLQEASQTFNSVSEETLPVPPRFIPVFPAQKFQPDEMGEVFIRI